MLKTVLISAAALAALSAPALAHDAPEHGHRDTSVRYASHDTHRDRDFYRGPGVADIQARQDWMVRAGVRNGQLTQRELNQIRAVDAENRALIRRLSYRSGGDLNRRDRAIVMEALADETDLIQALSANRARVWR
ncbi:MAG: hypothetical protein GC189_10495 [Alphaproteobacteria bacterium]|nr:hypothetical protein [Alphaproteobacteria bacterium]